METKTENQEPKSVEVTFRQFPIYNGRGVRFDPVELDGGGIVDFGSLPRPTRKRIKNNLPKVWEAIVAYRGEIITPIRVDVYKCKKCGATINAFVLDKGLTPDFMPCSNCKIPTAEKKFTSEVAKGIKPIMKPTVFFRNCTEVEFDNLEELGKNYILEGGLFMELAKSE